MGYTHYWEYRPELLEEEDWIARWGAFVKDLERFFASDVCPPVCDDSDARGIRPVVDSGLVRFNGVEPDGYETFYLPAVGISGAYCKTERKPYDLAVCVALILACRHLSVRKGERDSMRVCSDGFWFNESTREPAVNQEWQEAFDVAKSMFGISAEIRRDGNTGVLEVPAP